MPKQPPSPPISPLCFPIFPFMPCLWSCTVWILGRNPNSTPGSAARCWSGALSRLRAARASRRPPLGLCQPQNMRRLALHLPPPLPPPHQIPSHHHLSTYPHTPKPHPPHSSASDTVCLGLCASVPVTLSRKDTPTHNVTALERRFIAQ